jgi:glucosamine--fructose-6-phosphate aminotransferase (isomerizing)
MYVATVALAAVLAERADLLQSMDRLSDSGRDLIGKAEALARSVGSDLSLDRFYFLGSGPRYGLACETNLKMKEMSLTHSEPFHFLEFRHGPKSMVGASTMVVGLLSQANRAYEGAVLKEVQELGGNTLVLAESAAGSGVEADVPLESDVPEAVRNVLYLPALQLLAFYRAVSKGLDPDQPHNLDAVVKLE